MPGDEGPRRAVVVAGPTASGKSALAVDLAAAFTGTVINADAMQVYAGLPLLTAQPELAARARALIHGRYAPSLGDVAALAPAALKHRAQLTFAARAEGETLDGVLSDLTQAVLGEPEEA